MRFNFLFSLLLPLIIFCSNAYSQDEQGLAELLSPIRSLQGNFVQTILDGKGKAIQRSEGTMALQRPGQFRWEVTQPIPQLIIANSSRIWIYDPDLQQVVVRPLAKAAGQTPAFLLTNVGSAINKDFIIRNMPAPRDWQWFSLRPRNNDSMFSTIQLGFHNHEIKEMRMQDSLGHSTVIQFQHLKINGALSASLFRFHPPANVDIVDETR